MAKEYRTITEIAGPLIFVEKTEPVGYNELVEVHLGDGRRKRGQVLDSSTTSLSSRSSKARSESTARRA